VPFVLSGEVSISLLRYLTAGESHGPQLTAILDGLPAGVPVCAKTIDHDLARRQRGYGRGGRMAIERDHVQIVGGVRHGRSLGSPIALLIENRDWANWEQEMSAAPATAEWSSARPVRMPRPGHADLAGAIKYGWRDMRNILERASARETAARVAVGAVCRGLLTELGIEVHSAVVRIGPAAWQSPERWDDALLAAAEASDVGCPDETVCARMREAIDAARAEGDTLGGVFEVRASGVPVGLGSHVSSDRRLDGRLAGALMSVPAIKGVEVGLGFAAAERPGSQVHDPIRLATHGTPLPFARGSNNAGGIEGGISNGEEIVVRAAMKPIPTLMRPLGSVDLDAMAHADAHAERSDVCAVPAAAVVGEAAVCFELARAILDDFTGSNVGDLQAAIDHLRADRRRLWGKPEGA
jgi:chorismate synthase